MKTRRVMALAACLIQTVSIFVSVSTAYADGAIPAGDVSCSLTSTGVEYGVSMTFSSGNVSIGNLTYDWDYSLLNSGGNPALVANYTPRQFFKSTDGNLVDLTYNELLNLASGNPNATILVFTSPKNSIGTSVIKNTSGKGCYVDLPTVLNNTVVASKAAADKAAVDKAAADKAAVDKAAADKAAADTTWSATYAQAVQIRKDLQVQVDSFSALYPKLAGNLQKMFNGLPPVPKSADALDAWKDQASQQFAVMKSWVTKEMSLSKQSLAAAKLNILVCSNGKVLKKFPTGVTACPKGWKKK